MRDLDAGQQAKVRGEAMAPREAAAGGDGAMDLTAAVAEVRLEEAGEVLVEVEAAAREICGRHHLVAALLPRGRETHEHATRGAAEIARRCIGATEQAGLHVVECDHTGLAERAAIAGEHRAQSQLARRDLGLTEHRDVTGLARLTEAVVMQHVGDHEFGVRTALRCFDRDRAMAVRGAELVTHAPAAPRAELEIDRARGGEPALLEIERTLARDDAVHGFGDHEAEVRVALPVHVRELVDRDATDADREIRAVDRIEATQEELLAFALAAVLARVEAGHEAEQIVGVLVRSEVDRAPFDGAHAVGRRVDG